jgi:hypothetical protein
VVNHERYLFSRNYSTRHFGIDVDCAAGAIALMMTKTSFEKPKIQALSAFSGTGFTAVEAERVVTNSHPRKVVS